MADQRLPSAKSWPTALVTCTAVIVVPVAASILTPLVLGALTVVRQKIFWRKDDTKNNFETAQTSSGNNSSSSSSSSLSTLLTGRVWHSRFHPTKHAFTYPLFIFGIDLDDEACFNQRLWPLSWIMHFSTRHHLINGEGKDCFSSSDNDKSLRDRIYTLVDERTLGKLKPTKESHCVWLVTHLSYYGYNFNPVSFYYLFNRITGRMDAIVAEVSNTPWIEMYPYVLHPASTDKVECLRKNDDGQTNYQFPKTFHVSPFMEMSYMYDWIFEGEEAHIISKNDGSLRVTTAMVKEEDGSKRFTATMRVKQAGLHPMKLAWQLARYPSYCAIIQIWIHYEAFWLFWKGVSYQPHPNGSETTASRMIGTLMAPFFQLQAWLSKTETKEI